MYRKYICGLDRNFHDRGIEGHRERICGGETEFLIPVAPIFDEGDVGGREGGGHVFLYPAPAIAAISPAEMVGPYASDLERRRENPLS